jgi:hypothetical protein
MTKSSSLPVGNIWAPRLARIEDEVLIPEKSKLHPTPGILLSTGWIKRRAPKSLLTVFCNIAEAPDTERAVKAFASKWGMLGLCHHGLPSTHNSNCHSDHETVDAYKNLSLCFSCLQRIGFEIAAGRCGEPIDWELADSILCAEDFPPWDKLMRSSIVKFGVARDYLQIMMGRLTAVSRLQPRLAWNDGSWVIDFDALEGPNVVAILTLQLIAGIAGGALRKCRDCPRWFQPRGRKVYCDACGIQASWRAASKRQREKGNVADSVAARVVNKGKKASFRSRVLPR